MKCSCQDLVLAGFADLTQSQRRLPVRQPVKDEDVSLRFHGRHSAALPRGTRAHEEYLSKPLCASPRSFSAGLSVERPFGCHLNASRVLSLHFSRRHSSLSSWHLIGWRTCEVLNSWRLRTTSFFRCGLRNAWTLRLTCGRFASRRAGSSSLFRDSTPRWERNTRGSGRSVRIRLSQRRLKMKSSFSLSWCPRERLRRGFTSCNRVTDC